MLLFCPEDPIMGFQPERGQHGSLQILHRPLKQAGQYRDERSCRRGAHLF